MKTSSVTELELFNFCVLQLLNTFVSIKNSQNDWANKSDSGHFRVPIRLYLSQHRKKFVLPTKNGTFTFSKRQIECIQCLIDGMSAKETGSRLFLSQRTVETYLNYIKYKLNCRTKREIIGVVYTY